MRHALVPLLALALLACGLRGTETYQVTGVVQSVDLESGQIRIAHDDIAGFMPAMTMNFDVVRSDLLVVAAAGDRVRFELERNATLLRITKIENLGPSGRALSGEGVGVVGAPLDELAPEFTLTDQEGQPLSLADLRGEAVLLDFIFTRCAGPCPILTSAHVSLQRALPAEVAQGTRFLSVSLDPEYDTPARLKAYAEQRGADLARWSFLTGDPEQVREILRDYHVGTIVQPDGTLDHLVITFLIAPDGRIARRYLGLQQPEDAIVADLREVLG